MKTFKFVTYLWDDAAAGKLTPAGRLIYRSNILGADQRITNTGGGNTSAKIMEKDPLTGEQVEVLWVKGSGGDLRTSKLENFSSLYQERLIGLQKIYARGGREGAEDADRGLPWWGCIAHTTFNLNPRASSIDTPLHSFVPFKHVDHTHPNAAISVAASKNSEALTKKIYGDDVIWTPGSGRVLTLGCSCRRSAGSIRMRRE